MMINEFKPLKIWCQKVLPLVYDDSLSYYEVLAKVTQYLNELAENANETGEAIGEIQTILGDIENLQQYVDEWLDEHPEATTTVEDGAISEAKIAPQFLPEIKNPFVTPQMFGAVAYDPTNPSVAVDARQAFVDAIQYCQTHKCDLMLISDYYINAYVNGVLTNLYTYSNIRILGNSSDENRPTIYLDVPTNLVNTTYTFIITNSVLTLKDFNIRTKNGYSQNTVAIRCNGVGLNCDTLIDHVGILNFDTGVIVRGRNVKFLNSEFSYCHNGILFEPVEPTVASVGQFRGWIVNSCRFHGISNLAQANWFESGACITVNEPYYSNVQIVGCHSDLCGTFYKGTGTNVFISGCFLENYKAIQIDIGDENSSGAYAPGQSGIISIVGNYITGKAGQVSSSERASFPEYLIRVTRTWRVNITGNTLKLADKALIKAIQCTWLNISENSTALGGQDNVSTNAFVDATNCTAMFIKGNTSLANSTYLLVGNGNTNCRMDGNNNYLVSNLSGATFINANKQFITFATVVGSDISTGVDVSALPDHFYVQFRDGSTLFECSHHLNYFSSPVCQKADNSGFYTLRWYIEDGKVVPQITERLYASIETATIRGYTCDILVEA